MSNTGTISGGEMQKLLEFDGFTVKSHKGSHVKLQHPERGNITVVPMHRQLKVGTVGGILKQAGWSRDDLERTRRGELSQATREFRARQTAAPAAERRGRGVGG